VSLSIDHPVHYQTMARVFKTYRGNEMRLILAEIALHSGTSRQLAESIKVELERTKRIPELEIIKAFYPNDNGLKHDFYVREAFKEIQNADHDQNP